MATIECACSRAGSQSSTGTSAARKSRGTHVAPAAEDVVAHVVVLAGGPRSSSSGTGWAGSAVGDHVDVGRKPEMNPKLIRVTVSPAPPSSAKRSMTWVASDRMLRRRYRSPGRADSLIGASRRVRPDAIEQRAIALKRMRTSNRFESTHEASSDASRNSTRTRSTSHSARDPGEAEKSLPPRTSSTAPTLGRAPAASSVSSSSGRSICGGRLSTTYQSRSSSALPTVERRRRTCR